MQKESSLPPHSLISAGVDWLTATAYRTPKNEPFYELGRELLAQAAGHGNDVSNWSAQGYKGLKSSGVRVGLRHDTFIVQLSSDDARDNWQPVVEASTNVSRLDLQVTFELERARSDFFRSEHARAIHGTRGRGRRSNVTLITSTTGGDSIYLGQRSSDVYARCYDKGMESKTAPKCKVIRHELEFKRDRARDVVARLRAASDAEAEASSIVCGFMNSKLLRTPAHSEGNRESARARLTSDNDRRLRWLSSAVAPSIKILLEAGRRADVLRVLGITEECERGCRMVNQFKGERNE